MKPALRLGIIDEAPAVLLDIARQECIRALSAASLN